MVSGVINYFGSDLPEGEERLKKEISRLMFTDKKEN